MYYVHIKYANSIPIKNPNKRRELIVIEYNLFLIVHTKKFFQSVEEKFYRNIEKPASNDIAVREFKIERREIHLKYHYGKDKITASTRYFIKPPLGEEVVFIPELTGGYHAEIGEKPPRPSQLFLLLLKQLEEEEKTMNNIRDMEKAVRNRVFLDCRINKLYH